MTDAHEEVTALLNDHPDLADDLHTLLEIDERQDKWTFDDIPIDSGLFGELVGRGIITQTANGYEITDRHALQAALGTDSQPIATSSPTPNIYDRLTDLKNTTQPTVFGWVLAGLTLLIAFRVFVYPSVFRGEHVVLLGNDPYYYRHHVHTMLDSGAKLVDVPTAIKRGEPLLVSILVAATRALGGTTDTANNVLAWYPIAAAVSSAILCYSLAVTLSRDRRVGLAALLVLTVLPAHAYRTALGYADHHALDFLWLAIVIVAAVHTLPTDTLRRQAQSWRSQLPWAGLLAIGIAAQTHSWNAAPLLITPFVAYGVVRSATLAHTNTSPLADIPLLLGVSGGGLLAVLGHVVLGWQSTVIVGAPILAAIGLALGLAAAAIVRRQSLPAWTAAAATATIGLVVLMAAARIDPSFGAELQQELSRLVGMSGSNIAETQSLFSADYGLFVGPIFLYGTALLFALPAGAWAFYAGTTRPRWLLTASFGLVLFVLSIAQVRFTGELSLFVAVFAGFAFVYFLDVVDITDPPHVFASSDTSRVRSFSVPTRQTMLSLSLAFLLVTGLGAVMTPLRTNSLVISDSNYTAATWMEDHVESPAWTGDHQYVFSHWDTNRMYNAFVSGNSLSYGYAQTNYQAFLGSTNSTQWYQRLRGRAGFIVADNNSVTNENATTTMATRLAEWGRGLSHYRVVWASENTKKKIYTLVSGATITGDIEPNTTVTVTHHEQVSDHNFTYTRTVSSSADGTYQITVPYPGTYTVNGTEVTISENAITNGTQVIPTG